MARRKVEMELRMPVAAINWIDQQAKAGILGETRDQVIEHILRSYLFACDQQKPIQREKTSD